MLIKCPDCEKEISDKAKICINCGCPVAELLVYGTVKIKIPENLSDVWGGSFSSQKAVIYNSSGEVLWEGIHGETAVFKIRGDTEIVIDLGGWIDRITGVAKKDKCYLLKKLRNSANKEIYVLIMCE